MHQSQPKNKNHSPPSFLAPLAPLPAPGVLGLALMLNLPLSVLENTCSLFGVTLLAGFCGVLVSVLPTGDGTGFFPTFSRYLLCTSFVFTGLLSTEMARSCLGSGCLRRISGVLGHRKGEGSASARALRRLNALLQRVLVMLEGSLRLRRSSSELDSVSTYLERGGRRLRFTVGLLLL